MSFGQKLEVAIWTSGGNIMSRQHKAEFTCWWRLCFKIKKKLKLYVFENHFRWRPEVMLTHKTTLAHYILDRSIISLKVVINYLQPFRRSFADKIRLKKKEIGRYISPDRKWYFINAKKKEKKEKKNEVHIMSYHPTKSDQNRSSQFREIVVTKIGENNNN
jgi:hypothetical protein